MVRRYHCLARPYFLLSPDPSSFISTPLCFLCLNFPFFHSFNLSLVCFAAPACICTFPRLCSGGRGMLMERLALQMIQWLLSGQRAIRGIGGDEEHDVASVWHVKLQMHALNQDKHVRLCKRVTQRLDLCPITLKYFALQNNPHSNRSNKSFKYFLLLFNENLTH